VLDENRMDFGRIAVGATALHIVSVRNTSDEAVDVVLEPGPNFELCGPRPEAAFCLEPGGLALSADRRLRLGASQTLSLRLRFSPTVPNARERGSFRLQVCLGEDPGCRLEFELAGAVVGRLYECQPPFLDFGAVEPGTSLSLSVTCRALSDQPVRLRRAFVDPVGVADFVQTPPIGFEPLLGRNFDNGLEVSVRYGPETLGVDRATLVLESAMGASRRLDIPLRGSGGGPILEVDEHPIDFGLAAVGGLARRRLSIANVGFSDLELEMEVLGDDASAFEIFASAREPLPRRLNVQEEQTLELRFHPGAERIQRAQLLLRSNQRPRSQRSIPLMGEGLDLPPCELEVSTDRLEFGLVDPIDGDEGIVRFRSLSEQVPCLISQLQFDEDAAPDFLLVRPAELPAFVPAGGSLDVVIRATPDRPSFLQGSFEYTVSNAASPFGQVELSADARQVLPLVSPSPLDFGSVPLGCTGVERELEIINQTNELAVINEIGPLGTPEFVAMALPNLPVLLPPKTKTELRLAFRPDPETTGELGATLRMEGLLGGAVYAPSVDLRARTSSVTRVRESFVASRRTSVDLLVLLEDSFSIVDRRLQLRNGFRAIVEGLAANQVDFQLGVAGITRLQQPGHLLPLGSPDRIVTPLTEPSPLQVFLDNVDVRVKTGARTALDALYAAMSEPLLTGANLGFLRPGADLAVLVVMDGGDDSFADLDFIERFLLARKGGDPRRIDVSILGGVPSSECENVSTASEVLELGFRFSGEVLDICAASLHDELDRFVAHLLANPRRFHLQYEPVPEELTVLVDGEPVVASRWRYEPDRRSILFSSAHRPPAGSIVTVEFPRAACVGSR